MKTQFTNELINNTDLACRKYVFMYGNINKKQ